MDSYQFIVVIADYLFKLLPQLPIAIIINEIIVTNVGTFV